MSKIIRKVISSAKAPAAIGPYSQAIQVNHMLHVSGQLGLVAETANFAGNDVESQTKQALKNLGYILEEAGCSYNNVVETTILLSDMKDYKSVNDIYATFFSEPFPARAAYQCAALPKAAKIEIKAMAIVGDVEESKSY